MELLKITLIVLQLIAIVISILRLIYFGINTDVITIMCLSGTILLLVVLGDGEQNE